MIKSLNQDQSLELLRKERIGRLGCISEGEPYVVPVNYVFDGECAYLHSLPGQKIEAMRSEPRVCLQVDEIEDELNWKSVLAYGTYEEITNRRERAEALGLIRRAHEVGRIRPGTARGGLDGGLHRGLRGIAEALRTDLFVLTCHGSPVLSAARGRLAIGLRSPSADFPGRRLLIR